MDGIENYPHSSDISADSGSNDLVHSRNDASRCFVRNLRQNLIDSNRVSADHILHESYFILLPFRETFSTRSPKILGYAAVFPDISRNFEILCFCPYDFNASKNVPTNICCSFRNRQRGEHVNIP